MASRREAIKVRVEMKGIETKQTNKQTKKKISMTPGAFSNNLMKLLTP